MSVLPRHRLVHALLTASLRMPMHLSGQAPPPPPPRTELLVRIDDIGMSHAVNQALQELADTRMPLSASVLFVCPWYQEAVEILKKNPQIDRKSKRLNSSHLS